MRKRLRRIRSPRRRSVFAIALDLLLALQSLEIEHATPDPRRIRSPFRRSAFAIALDLLLSLQSLESERASPDPYRYPAHWIH
jgi:hypothetical protein